MTGTLAHIFRHPIKAHGREELQTADLLTGKCLPWDRYWAVAHEAARLREGWNPCMNFVRGAKAPELMAITARLDEAKKTVTLHHPCQGELTFAPDAPEDLDRFLEWVTPLVPESRSQPAKIMKADRGMTDSQFESVSILSLSSLKDLSTKMNCDLSVDRWRGNLWLSGGAPFDEFGWIGKKVSIGQTVLQIEKRITRCKATMVNPETGVSDTDTLGALATVYGHRDFGVYATVVEAGKIHKGDRWSIVS